MFQWIRPTFARYRQTDSDGHPALIRTDENLQLGTPPSGIERDIPIRLGTTNGFREVQGFPNTSDSLFTIPHLPFTRINPGGRIMVAPKESDNSIGIPSIYIGNG